MRTVYGQSIDSYCMVSEEYLAQLKQERDEARAWARHLYNLVKDNKHKMPIIQNKLDFAIKSLENIYSQHEHINTRHAQGAARLALEALDELDEDCIWDEELDLRCGACNSKIQIVRSGKWQCPNCG